MGVLLIYPWLKYLALGYAGQQIVARTAGFYSVSGFLYILGYIGEIYTLPQGNHFINQNLNENTT